MEQINVDLIPGKVLQVCHASQYDVGRTIRVNLFEGGQVYTFDGTQAAQLKVRKTDGNVVTTALTATMGNSYVEIETTQQMTACAGLNMCDIVIIDSSNSISTANFFLNVEQDPLDGGINSASEIHDLQAQVDAAVASSVYVNELAEITQAIPYNGGLSALNADPEADPTKTYYAIISGANNRRIMKYDSNSSAFVYSNYRYMLGDITGYLFENVFGFIPYEGSRATIATDPLADKNKLYYCSKQSSVDYLKVLTYNFSTSAWSAVGGVVVRSAKERGDEEVGAIEYYGGLAQIGADPNVDTSKTYYIYSTTSANHLRKIKYDTTTSSWKWSDRVQLDADNSVTEMLAQLCGAMPYYGTLTEINGDPFVDTAQVYLEAMRGSANYMRLMIYNIDTGAWVYSDKLEPLYQKTNSVNVENTQVLSYMRETLYDGSDYTYNNILKYAIDDYDKPSYTTINWSFTGTCDNFKIKQTVTGDYDDAVEFTVANNVKTFKLENMIPGTQASVKVSAVTSGVETVIATFAVLSSGQVRMLDVDGIHNVRDIGGWALSNGKKIKYNQILRGSAIDEANSTITADGKKVLYDVVGIRTEIDLRSDGAADTSDIGPDCTRYRIKGYSYLSGFNDTTAAYNVLSKIMTEAVAGKKIYIHCSGGCDRTAFYVCMLEGLLGVSENDITKDFELSSFMKKSLTNGYRRYRDMGTTYSNRDWEGLIALIKNETGTTWGEKFYNYFIRIGITDADITAFRNAMTV